MQLLFLFLGRAQKVSNPYHKSWDKYVYESGNGILLEEGYKINEILLTKLGAGTGNDVTLKTTFDMPYWNVDKYDVSELQDDSAYIWRGNAEHDDSNTIYLTVQSSAYFNKNSANMFANCTALKRIDLDGIHQENNIDGYDFSGMFDNCANLNSLALADCSKQSYSGVLKCSGLTSLYLGNIDMRTFYLPPLPDGYV